MQDECLTVPGNCSATACVAATGSDSQVASRTSRWAHAALLSGALAVAACGDGGERAPAGFAPARAIVRAHGRIARCNTVHSLTLPWAVISRYGLHADDETGIISCSLQVHTSGLPMNTRALIAGTATTLTGSTERLGFEEVLDQGVVSYVATFPLSATSRIDFDVHLYDPITGRRYDVQFRQSALPGRRSPALAGGPAATR